MVMGHCRDTLDGPVVCCPTVSGAEFEWSAVRRHNSGPTQGRGDDRRVWESEER